MYAKTETYIEENGQETLLTEEVGEVTPDVPIEDFTPSMTIDDRKVGVKRYITRLVQIMSI